MRTSPRTTLLVTAVLALVACGGDTESVATGSGVEAPTATETPNTAVASTTAPVTEAPVTEAPSTTATPGTAMRTLRYCEILLLSPGAEGIVATVFNSYPLGDCPSAQWSAIDTQQIAIDTGAVFVLANGPRYWLMDSAGRADDDVETETFGGIPMNRYATVTITDVSSVGRPYVAQKVDRRAVFTFAAGSRIYYLVDPDGRRFVMQSWSQQVDAELAEEDLVDLAPRIDLPEGWVYGWELLEDDLVVDTRDRPAEVLQDPLLNSYSLVE